MKKSLLITAILIANLHAISFEEALTPKFTYLYDSYLKKCDTVDRNFELSSPTRGVTYTVGQKTKNSFIGTLTWHGKRYMGWKAFFTSKEACENFARKR